MSPEPQDDTLPLQGFPGFKSRRHGTGLSGKSGKSTPVPSEPFRCSFEDPQRQAQPEDSHTHRSRRQRQCQTPEEGKTQQSSVFLSEELFRSALSIQATLSGPD